MSVEVEYATERLMIARHEWMVHAYRPMMEDVGDDWQEEFMRLYVALREAHMDKAMAEMGLSS